jgi:hypothetical protein
MVSSAPRFLGHVVPVKVCRVFVRMWKSGVRRGQVAFMYDFDKMPMVVS